MKSCKKKKKKTTKASLVCWTYTTAIKMSNKCQTFLKAFTNKEGQFFFETLIVTSPPHPPKFSTLCLQVYYIQKIQLTKKKIKQVFIVLLLYVSILQKQSISQLNKNSNINPNTAAVTVWRYKKLQVKVLFLITNVCFVRHHFQQVKQKGFEESLTTKVVHLENMSLLPQLTI